jgi:hypothetical protein
MRRKGKDDPITKDRLEHKIQAQKRSIQRKNEEKAERRKEGKKRRDKKAC